GQTRPEKLLCRSSLSHRTLNRLRLRPLDSCLNSDGGSPAVRTGETAHHWAAIELSSLDPVSRSHLVFLVTRTHGRTCAGLRSCRVMEVIPPGPIEASSTQEI